jgi:fructose-specific component phosphotransferase system IIB-like protein
LLRQLAFFDSYPPSLGHPLPPWGRQVVGLAEHVDMTASAPAASAAPGGSAHGGAHVDLVDGGKAVLEPVIWLGGAVVKAEPAEAAAAVVAACSVLPPSPPATVKHEPGDQVKAVMAAEKAAATAADLAEAEEEEDRGQWANLVEVEEEAAAAAMAAAKATLAAAAEEEEARAQSAATVATAKATAERGWLRLANAAEENTMEVEEAPVGGWLRLADAAGGAKVEEANVCPPTNVFLHLNRTVVEVTDSYSR